MSLPTTQNFAEPTEAELYLMKRAQRGVIFLCIMQLFAAIFSLLAFGSVVYFILTLLFVGFGLGGVRGRKTPFLALHFGYSIGLYVVTLVGIILMIFYCDECSLVSFILAFTFLFAQAFGLRQARLNLQFAKRFGPSYRPAHCAPKSLESVHVQGQPEYVFHAPPAYEMHTMAAPGAPHYYIPMQPVMYPQPPIMMQPIPVAPTKEDSKN